MIRLGIFLDVKLCHSTDHLCQDGTCLSWSPKWCLNTYSHICCDQDEMIRKESVESRCTNLAYQILPAPWHKICAPQGEQVPQFSTEDPPTLEPKRLYLHSCMLTLMWLRFLVVAPLDGFSPSFTIE
ncbi:MADS-box domain-containing protein [Psidium guajava]|nr:MADS-box domain-containing protein [Psidium guajava]